MPYYFIAIIYGKSDIIYYRKYTGLIFKQKSTSSLTTLYNSLTNLAAKQFWGYDDHASDKKIPSKNQFQVMILLNNDL